MPDPNDSTQLFGGTGVLSISTKLEPYMNRLLDAVVSDPTRFPRCTPGPSVAMVAMSIALLLARVGTAHEGSSQAHDHSETDMRETPRTADKHVTGTLPRATAATTSAKSRVSFNVRDGYRLVVANGIPDHETGSFPNQGNPNVVSEQQYSFRLPLDPSPPRGAVLDTSNVHSDRGYLFGIALNGVPFEPATGMNWTPEGIRRGGKPGDWVHEAIGGSVNFGIDHANAHVQRTGAYHYHGIPTPLINDKHPTLVGYAADGYPIYGPLGYQDPLNAKSPLVRLRSSWQLKTTERPEPQRGPGGTPDGRYTADFEFKSGSGDLDRLNGRFAATPEYPKGVYHYVLTEDFPHVPRGFAGKPDASFHRAPGEGPNHVNQRGGSLPLGNRAEDASR